MLFRCTVVPDLWRMEVSMCSQARVTTTLVWQIWLTFCFVFWILWLCYILQLARPTCILNSIWKRFLASILCWKSTNLILFNTITIKIKGTIMAKGQIHVMTRRKHMSPCIFALVWTCGKGIPSETGCPRNSQSSPHPCLTLNVNTLSIFKRFLRRLYVLYWT